VNNAPYGVDELGVGLGCLGGAFGGVGGDFLVELAHTASVRAELDRAQARAPRPRGCDYARRVGTMAPSAAIGEARASLGRVRRRL
jgi:hypothetical protein